MRNAHYYLFSICRDEKSVRIESYYAYKVKVKYTGHGGDIPYYEAWLANWSETWNKRKQTKNDTHAFALDINGVLEPTVSQPTYSLFIVAKKKMTNEELYDFFLVNYEAAWQKEIDKENERHAKKLKDLNASINYNKYLLGLTDKL